MGINHENPLPTPLGESQKQELYQQITLRIQSHLQYLKEPIAAMATIVAELHHSLPYSDWTGFYLCGPTGLTVGPYQGKVACTQIPLGKGVCGEVAQSGVSQVVSDVLEHHNHIACSASTRAEVVVALQDQSGKVVGVLDIDSDQVGAFDQIDQHWLEIICSHLSQLDFER